MRKHAIVGGTLIGAGLGATQTPHDPAVGGVAGGAIGAGVHHALGRVGVPLLAPVGAIGGAYLGAKAMPDQPLVGGLLGLGGGTLLTSGLTKPFGGGLGWTIGLPALIGAGVVYALQRAQKEKANQFWNW